MNSDRLEARCCRGGTASRSGTALSHAVEGQIPQPDIAATDGQSVKVRAHEKGVHPPLPKGFEYRLELAPAATARELKASARHRWFYFPHSYSPRLVHGIIDHWELPKDALVADNFVGSGTSLLASMERGIRSVGFDLSPLAVLASNTKVGRYDPQQLKRDLQRVLGHKAKVHCLPMVSPGRLTRAFTERELAEIVSLGCAIRRLPRPAASFFRLALLWTARRFSRAVPDGGWFRWKQWPDRSEEFKEAFEATAFANIEDVEATDTPVGEQRATAHRADARKLPVGSSTIDGIITSPPYVNRHDYSRVFHIDLLLQGLQEPAITRLRKHSVRSHVEAQMPAGFSRKLNDYREPSTLETALGTLPSDADRRIDPMVRGYFQDLFLVLLETCRVLKPGGKAAYVVGNARHAGVMIPADEVLAQLAPPAGLEFEAGWVIRLRGNSAQQMGQYGRQPARETVVLLRKG